MVLAEGSSDVVDIRHRAHIDPSLRHRDYHIGETKSKSIDQHHAFVRVRDHLANKIFPGDTEVHGARRELAGNFGCRQIIERAAVEVRNRQDPDFVIVARTDAFGAVGGSLDEAIWRGRAPT